MQLKYVQTVFMDGNEYFKKTSQEANLTDLHMWSTCSAETQFSFIQAITAAEELNHRDATVPFIPPQCVSAAPTVKLVKTTKCHINKIYANIYTGTVGPAAPAGWWYFMKFSIMSQKLPKQNKTLRIYFIILTGPDHPLRAGLKQHVVKIQTLHFVFFNQLLLMGFVSLN